MSGIVQAVLLAAASAAECSRGPGSLCSSQHQHPLGHATGCSGCSCLSLYHIAFGQDFPWGTLPPLFGATLSRVAAAIAEGARTVCELVFYAHRYLVPLWLVAGCSAFLIGVGMVRGDRELAEAADAGLLHLVFFCFGGCFAALESEDGLHLAAALSHSVIRSN